MDNMQCVRCEMTTATIQCEDCSPSDPDPSVYCDECSGLVHVGKLGKHRLQSICFKEQKIETQQQLNEYKKEYTGVEHRLHELEQLEKNVHELLKVHERNIRCRVIELQDALKRKAQELMVLLKEAAGRRVQEICAARERLTATLGEMIQCGENVEKMLELDDFEFGKKTKEGTSIIHQEWSHADLSTLDIPSVFINFKIDFKAVEEKIAGIQVEFLENEPLDLTLDSPKFEKGEEVQVMLCSQLQKNGTFSVTPRHNKEAIICLYSLSVQIRSELIRDPTWQTYSCLETLPAENEFVCARHPVDKKWYRACVREKVKGSQGEVMVMFVDYGNMITVSLDSLLPWRDIAPHCQFQAMVCTLFPTLDVQLIIDHIWLFHDLTRNSSLYCCVLDKLPDTSIWQVELSSQQERDKDKVSINEKIVPKVSHSQPGGPPQPSSSIACRDIRYLDQETDVVLVKTRSDTGESVQGAAEKAVDGGDVPPTEQGTTDEGSSVDNVPPEEQGSAVDAVNGPTDGSAEVVAEVNGKQSEVDQVVTEVSQVVTEASKEVSKEVTEVSKKVTEMSKEVIQNVDEVSPDTIPEEAVSKDDENIEKNEVDGENTETVKTEVVTEPELMTDVVNPDPKKHADKQDNQVDKAMVEEASKIEDDVEVSRSEVAAIREPEGLVQCESGLKDEIQQQDDFVQDMNEPTVLEISAFDSDASTMCEDEMCLNEVTGEYGPASASAPDAAAPTESLDAPQQSVSDIVAKSELNHTAAEWHPKLHTVYSQAPVDTSVVCSVIEQDDSPGQARSRAESVPEEKVGNILMDVITTVTRVEKDEQQSDSASDQQNTNNLQALESLGVVEESKQVTDEDRVESSSVIQIEPSSNQGTQQVIESNTDIDQNKPPCAIETYVPPTPEKEVLKPASSYCPPSPAAPTDPDITADSTDNPLGAGDTNTDNTAEKMANTRAEVDQQQPAGCNGDTDVRTDAKEQPAKTKAKKTKEPAKRDSPQRPIKSKAEMTQPSPRARPLAQGLPSVGMYEGQSFKGRVVSELAEDGVFWLQLARVTASENQAYQRLEQQLQEYSKLATMVSAPCLGMFVLVQHRGLYHRGVVRALQASRALVVLIDLGHKVSLPTAQLRTLHEGLSQPPSQAIECCLQTAEYSCFTDDARKLFTKLTKDRVLDAFVEQVSAHKTYVKLYDSSDDKAPINVYQRITEEDPEALADLSIPPPMMGYGIPFPPTMMPQGGHPTATPPQGYPSPQQYPPGPSQGRSPRGSGYPRPDVPRADPVTTFDDDVWQEGEGVPLSGSPRQHHGNQPHHGNPPHSGHHGNPPIAGGQGYSSRKGPGYGNKGPADRQTDRYPGPNPVSGRSSVACYTCHQEGHYRANCPNKGAQSSKPHSRQVRGNFPQH